MDPSCFSGRNDVRRLGEKDIPAVYELCRKNELYYRHWPPSGTRETIGVDMRALPPGKGPGDKYYLGFYNGGVLMAVLDLILEYPDRETAFIGFFMTEHGAQGRDLGTEIIEELCCALRNMGFAALRQGWVLGNPQAEHIWHKTDSGNLSDGELRSYSGPEGAISSTEPTQEQNPPKPAGPSSSCSNERLTPPLPAGFLLQKNGPPNFGGPLAIWNETAPQCG